MTSAAAACQTLLGERLASIRSIRYEADSAAMPSAPAALEIETKTGRFVHITPAGGGTCHIACGPAVAPAEPNRSLTRRWTDLTAEATQAFDGRPLVTRAEPIHRAGKICGCIIGLSNDHRLTCAFNHGEPDLRAN